MGNEANRWAGKLGKTGTAMVVLGRAPGRLGSGSVRLIYPKGVHRSSRKPEPESISFQHSNFRSPLFTDRTNHQHEGSTDHASRIPKSCEHEQAGKRKPASCAARVRQPAGLADRQ